MIFTEFRFFVFFAVVLLVHWGLRGDRPRKLWLLACSYFFYGCWDWRFLGLVFFSTGVDYVVARVLDRMSDSKGRRALLIVSLVVNLGILSVFKYANFFVDSFTGLATFLGLPFNKVTLEIVLPVGISFYTFQTLSYTIDVYRRHMPAEKRLLDFAVFVAFFPQLVAGPIVRAYDFIPQLKTLRTWDMVPVRWSVLLFSIGFFKKACLSDNFAPYIDAFFRDPQAYTLAETWLAVCLYAAQIYCDFSGYTDMAIAAAALLGYRLTENFAWPYFAPNITDFWRRWHISLSTWLRDYLYISLGGNRHGTLRTYRNLMLTMVLGGLWHGASWNFVLWGFMHGLALAVHKMAGGDRRRTAPPGRLTSLAGWLLTQTWVLLAWVPFRSANFATTLATYRQMFNFSALGASTEPKPFLVLWWVLAAMALCSYLTYKNVAAGCWKRIPLPVFAILVGLAWSVMIALKPVGFVPFIYFQF